MSDLAALHGPHAALLRAALALASPPAPGPGLDLACGAGLKTAWLAESLRPGPALGLDIDRGALAAAAPGGLILADALGLPIRPGSLGRVWCVAALGLFADEARALAEAAACLRPGGDLVLAVAGERWVRPRPWPAALLAALPPEAPPPPADGLGDELLLAVARAGLVGAEARAYLLEPPGLGLTAAAAPLADWAALAPLAGRLDPADAAAWGALAADEPEPEVAPVLIVVRAVRPGR